MWTGQTTGAFARIASSSYSTPQSFLVAMMSAHALSGYDHFVLHANPTERHTHPLNPAASWSATCAGMSAMSSGLGTIALSSLNERTYTTFRNISGLTRTAKERIQVRSSGVGWTT